MGGDFTLRVQGAALSTEIDLDDGTIYHLDHVQTDYGVASQPKPKEEYGQAGLSLWLPHEEAWEMRTLRIVGWLPCKSWNDKLYQESCHRQMIQGLKTFRRRAWEIDAFFMAPSERENSKASPEVYEWEAMGYVREPFWRMAASLAEIQYNTLLYPDFGIPYGEAQPAFDFYVTAPVTPEPTPFGVITASPGTSAHLTMQNWGTAFCYPSASLSGFPTSTTLYLRGLGRFRVKLVTDSNGAASLTPEHIFYLAPGINGIRFEDAAGTAIALGTSARVNFGSTKLRNL